MCLCAYWQPRIDILADPQPDVQRAIESKGAMVSYCEFLVSVHVKERSHACLIYMPCRYCCQ